MIKRIVLGVVVVAGLAVAAVQAQAGYRSCTTSCYGNTCTTSCY